jgi:hypothetical protein
MVRTPNEDNTQTQLYMRESVKQGRFPYERPETDVLKIAIEYAFAQSGGEPGTDPLGEEED